MRNSYRLVLVICLTLSLARMVSGTILPTWNDERAYRPIPAGFVHGMNSSPEAWGFQIDQGTEEVLGYTIPGTAYGLFQYFDNYLDKNPVTNEPLSYLEPFNYQYNTFDSIKWNAYEGYVDESGNVHNGEQYPDARISEEAARPTLQVYQKGGKIFNVGRTREVDISGILAKYQTSKGNLVAHSLGGVVSRYYINKTQGSNVKQLTTLGTPHKGAAVAKVTKYTLPEPVTDPFRWSIIWRVLFIKIFDNLAVDRKPWMIYELDPSSQFIRDLNSSIPAISRYYCIGGIIRVFPLSPVIAYTDAFIELQSALAVKGALPLALSHDYQPESILPNYKGKILFPGIVNIAKNKHTELPNKWEEILKAIDPAGRVDITEPKDGFAPPSEGQLIVKGKVYDEYLPADCKVEMKVLLEGKSEERIIDNPNPVSGEPAWVWRLQPTDLWRADDPNSPVAEFEIQIPAEYAMKVEKVKITVTNPGGYTSEDEVTWNLLIVDEGTKEVYCLDGPETMRQNTPVITNEFRLVDENGDEIESRPLGVAWDDTLGIFYVSFDDKKIRAYNEYGELVKTNSGKGYLEVPEMPDGLVNPFNNGLGHYVSEEASIARNFNYFNDVVLSGYEVSLLSERLGNEWVSVKVNPTDGVWEYSPNFTSKNRSLLWCLSEELGLVRRARWPFGDTFVAADSIPLGFNPTGVIQRGAYFYLISSDGRLYKKYCRNAQEWVTVERFDSGTGWQYDTKWSERLYSTLYSRYVNIYEFPTQRFRSFVRLDLSELPEEFYFLKIPMLIARFGMSSVFFPQWVTVNVNLDVTEAGWDYDDIYWTSQPDILEPLVHLIYPPFNWWGRGWGETLWDATLIDITDAVRERLASGEETLDIRCMTDEEGEGLRDVAALLGPMYVEETTWAIDLPSESPSDLGLGGKLRMRIKPGYPTSVNVGDIIQLEAHGKEPIKWESSDKTVGRVDSNGLFTAVGKGTCTVTVTDALGNRAISGDILVQ